MTRYPNASRSTILLLFSSIILCGAGCYDESDLQDARQQGYEQGYYEGHDVGRAQGLAEGHAQGRVEGYEKAMDQHMIVFIVGGCLLALLASIAAVFLFIARQMRRRNQQLEYRLDALLMNGVQERRGVIGRPSNDVHYPHSQRELPTPFTY